MDWMSRLSAHELQAVIDGLDDGSLRSPFPEIGVSRLFGSKTGGVVCSGLKALGEQGFSEKQVAAVCRLVQSDRSSRAQVASTDHIDLVWTGPEAEGTTNRDTKVVVQELFRSASTSVLIAGFAVYQGKDVFRALADSMDRIPGLAVDMFLNVHRDRTDTTRAEDLLKRFADSFVRSQWPGKRLPNVYYDPRSVALDAKKRAVLHAKCIVVDKSVAFISSANFTEAAQERNIEVGVLVTLPAFSERLQLHFEALKRARLVTKMALLN